MTNLARILFTVLCFGSFIVILLITYRKGARGGYDDIARQIVEDNDTVGDSEEDAAGAPGTNNLTHANGANK